MIFACLYEFFAPKCNPFPHNMDDRYKKFQIIPLKHYIYIVHTES